MEKTNSLKFQTFYQDGIWEYHYSIKENEFIFGENKGISENKFFFKKVEKIGEIYFLDFYEKYNISFYNTSENILLYMLFIWELAKKKKVFGFGSEKTSWIENDLKKPSCLVNWEYLLEGKLVSEKTIGFKNPVAPIHRSSYDKTPANQVGLFEIESFQELADFFKPTPDICKLINLYATATPNSIMNQLQSGIKPNIKTLLSNEDIFIGLLIGAEPGNYDYLSVKSKQDLTNILNPLTKKINGFANDYLLNIQDVKKIGDLTKLIENTLEKYGLQK